MTFNGRKIKGVLLDITGVLVESSGSGPKAIPGSVEAVKALQDASIAVRFVTNETQRTRISLVTMLRGNGYSMPVEAVFPPALAMASIIKKEQLRPFLLVHPNCLYDLQSPKITDEEYTCVILGDAVDEFNYSNLNKAFKVIMNNNCPLYALGKGKYYREDGDLTLDVGPFAAALEFATDRPAVVVGKPSR
jgi:phospholysine phosphohistidine inorganic pyrophosphate phosphatase